MAKVLHDRSEGEDYLQIPFEDSQVGAHLSTGIWEFDTETGQIYRMNERTSQVISDAIGQEAYVSGFSSIPNASGEIVTSMMVRLSPVVTD